MATTTSEELACVSAIRIVSIETGVPPYVAARQGPIFIGGWGGGRW